MSATEQIANLRAEPNGIMEIASTALTVVGVVIPLVLLLLLLLLLLLILLLLLPLTSTSTSTSTTSTSTSTFTSTLTSTFTFTSSSANFCYCCCYRLISGYTKTSIHNDDNYCYLLQVGEGSFKTVYRGTLLGKVCVSVN